MEQVGTAVQLVACARGIAQWVSPFLSVASTWAPLLILIFLSAFFSGSETALFSLADHQRAVLADRHGAAGARLRKLLDQAPRLLAALLIGNLVVNISASVLATSLLIRAYGNRGALLAVPVMTFVLLLAGEITPKILALRYGERISLLVQRPISAWVWLTQPLLRGVEAGTSALLRRLSRAYTTVDGQSGDLGAEELAMATEIAVQDAVLAETEGRFLSRMLTLGGMEVREIMTPRTDARLLEIGMDRARILEIARASGFNRYPVIQSEAELPVGIFHLKDLLAWGEGDVLLESALRGAVFVPETKEVAGLLTDLRVGPTHMSCVIDEHGDFVGLVTLEDCLETLTGPWADESDIGRSEIMAISDDRWLVAGTADLRGVNETCGTRLELSRHYVTLAGYMMARLGRIPASGDVLETDSHRLTVLAMSGHRILSIRVQAIGGGSDREAGS